MYFKRLQAIDDFSQNKMRIEGKGGEEMKKIKTILDPY